MKRDERLVEIIGSVRLAIGDYLLRSDPVVDLLEHGYEAFFVGHNQKPEPAPAPMVRRFFVGRGMTAEAAVAAAAARAAAALDAGRVVVVKAA